MFHSHVANLLQLLSLPLEILGLSLALIEIRYRPIAEYFRARILGTGEMLADHSAISPHRWLMAVALGVAVLAATWGIVEYSATELWIWASYVMVLTTVGVAILYLGRPTLRWIIELISRFADGREIGTLGLILAALGLLAESYQFADVVITLNEIERSAAGLSRFWETVAQSAYALTALVVVMCYGALIAGLVGYHRRRRAGATGNSIQ